MGSITIRDLDDTLNSRPRPVLLAKEVVRLKWP